MSVEKDLESYAGLSTHRLSELSGIHLARRGSKNTAFQVALRDNVSQILGKFGNRKDEVAVPFPDSHRKDDYAGIRSDRFNERTYKACLKKIQGPIVNHSNRMSEVLDNMGMRRVDQSSTSDPPLSPYSFDDITPFNSDRYCNRSSFRNLSKGTRRSMKYYVRPEDVGTAFSTRFVVTDPHTGRTEIMASRRPGKATTEVNISEFDAYSSRDRLAAPEKHITHIGGTPLGYSPRHGGEVQFGPLTKLTYLSSSMRNPHLAPCENWLTPMPSVRVEQPIGWGKRKINMPWNQSSFRLSNRTVYHDDKQRLIALGIKDEQRRPISPLLTPREAEESEKTKDAAAGRPVMLPSQKGIEELSSPRIGNDCSSELKEGDVPKTGREGDQ